ncbi:glycine zipper 2TM domain-containing protein [Phenylobacterium sp.]|uniref:glycine zipper 2TM domain-containing protein n=1 Tax=Phenylobacterium sp. TaxID=1871053 RepID=UPI002810AFA5|nr:glycine zipper 2TM domain-containing protein [Phenylobacterium sp.]
MKMKLIAAATLACSTLAFTVPPMAASAQSRERVYVCDKNVKKKSNNGALVGAVAGGVLGNVVAGNGAKTEGTVLGAGVGAVAGHQIAKKKAKRNCRWVYR